MCLLLKKIQFFAIAVAAIAMLTAFPPAFVALAQTASSPVAESTIKALQEALNKQGIAVKIDGVLNDETRAAIRKYQSQHHVPVTGEPDKVTLDKLGVQQSGSPAPVLAQAAPASPPASSSAPPQASQAQPAPGGMTMDCSMMHGQMQTMMQMMQGMMQMMAQMPPGQQRPSPMEPMQMQPGRMMPGAQ